MQETISKKTLSALQIFIEEQTSTIERLTAKNAKLAEALDQSRINNQCIQDEAIASATKRLIAENIKYATAHKQLQATLDRLDNENARMRAALKNIEEYAISCAGGYGDGRKLYGRFAEMAREAITNEQLKKPRTCWKDGRDLTKQEICATCDCTQR